MYYIQTNMFWYLSEAYKSYKEAVLECNKLKKQGYTTKIIRK